MTSLWINSFRGSSWLRISGGASLAALVLTTAAVGFWGPDQIVVFAEEKRGGGVANHEPGVGKETEVELKERADRLHRSALVFDGHNDLPWVLRKQGEWSFERLDLSRELGGTTHTDIPRLKAGGVKAQFWSIYIPTTHPEPSKTILEQIDVIQRMCERYPETFALTTTADELEAAVASGKIASLLGIEGGVAIENNLALLRIYRRLGVRYMTLCHNVTLDWVDSATDLPRSGGLSPFGERVVREMNRLGILVDISHVSAEAMRDVLKVARGPVIASHSGAFAVAGHPRNLPDDVLEGIRNCHGVAMIVFYPGFLVKEYAEAAAAFRKEARARIADPDEYEKAVDQWYDEHPIPKGSVSILADHIDHAVKIAGVDHVGLGSDFDGVGTTLGGVDDVASFPAVTLELLRRGYSEEDVRKILGLNALRVLRDAEATSLKLQSQTLPEVDPPVKRVAD